LWFAPTEASRAADAAKLKGNVVTLVPDAGVKAIVQSYRAAWQARGNTEADMPLVGVFRHVVVADTDEKARAVAREAYRLWRYNIAFLWNWGGLALPIGAIYLEEYDALEAAGIGIAGSPETVRRYVAAAIEQTGITYFVADMTFGSLPYAIAAHSVDLFAKEVMAAFR